MPNSAYPDVTTDDSDWSQNLFCHDFCEQFGVTVEMVNKCRFTG
jgi:hypothetical protein